MAYDIFRGQENNPEALRQMAADCRRAEQESFDRSDTDGCVSQWCSNLTAQQFVRQAEIAEAGGRSHFEGLYEGSRRVAAKLISRPKYHAPWATEWVWILRYDEEVKFGRRFIPHSTSYKGTGKSRIQKQLGLHQCRELAPAKTRLGGSGKGLSGLASAFVETYRTGDEWGLDATPVPSKTVDQ